MDPNNNNSTDPSNNLTTPSSTDPSAATNDQGLGNISGMPSSTDTTTPPSSGSPISPTEGNSPIGSSALGSDQTANTSTPQTPNWSTPPVSNPSEAVIPSPIDSAIPNNDQPTTTSSDGPTWSTPPQPEASPSPVSTDNTGPLGSTSLDNTGGATPPTEQTNNPFSPSPLEASPFSNNPTDPGSFNNPTPTDTTADQTTSPFGSVNPSDTTTTPTEAIPTDLSHLVGGTEGTPTAAPTPTPVENVVIAAPSADVNQAVTSSTGSGFPKWIIAVGAIVLLAVAGGSAYFILGVGKTNPVTEQQQPVPSSENQIIPPTQAPLQPVVTESSIPSTSSGTFGDLNGGTTPAASPSGTSALDLLRQRQGR